MLPFASDRGTSLRARDLRSAGDDVERQMLDGLSDRDRAGSITCSGASSAMRLTHASESRRNASDGVVCVL